METKAVQEKLQKAYRSMLEHIEELIDKDKKPLKEAFSEAEEKLSEWKELSREEIDNISTELKSNLRELGEASYSLKQSLNESLKVEAAYISSNLWDTLSSIVEKAADKTSIELSEFSESLQKNMSTDETTYSDQQKHWLNDTQNWLNDYDVALKNLTEIRVKVRAQLRQAKNHSKTILNNQMKQTEHDLLAQINQQTVQTIAALRKQLEEK